MKQINFSNVKGNLQPRGTVLGISQISYWKSLMRPAIFHGLLARKQGKSLTWLNWQRNVDCNYEI